MKIELSLTPALYPFRTILGQHTTVAIDVLRATTAVCAAFQAGCQYVVPVASLEELPKYRSLGYTLAAERNGQKVADADYGNSPTEYLKHNLEGTRLVYSTANGTVTMLSAADAKHLYCGAFANLSALVDRLIADNDDVVLLCSGWKNDYCIEDTLLAGAIVERMTERTSVECVGDAAATARMLWDMAKSDLSGFCCTASHVHRLQKFGAYEDIDFAFRIDTCPVVPELRDNRLSLVH